MSLLYRAMWESKTNNAQEALARCRQLFEAWATEDKSGITRTCVVRDQFDGMTDALEIRAADSGGGMLWRTTGRFRVVDGALYALVENHCEGDDVTTRISVASPRVVRQLLAANGGGALGGSALLAEPVAIGRGEVGVLCEILRSETRQLPVIVVTDPMARADQRYDWHRLAREVARRAAGVAIVVQLDEAAVREFSRELGPMAVWGGAIRTYAPAEVVEGSQLHRYLPWSSIAARGPKATADRLVFAVTQQSTRRRVLPELRGPSWDAATSGDAREELDELRREQDDLQDEVLALTVEQEELTRQLAHAQSHLERLREALEAHSLLNLYWGTAHAAEEAIPETVDAMSDALLVAQMYLHEFLVIPEGCGKDLEKLDANMNGYSWGNAALRGFRALAAFVQDRKEGFRGDFRAWCGEGRPNAWPATTKKLSMRESETVSNNRRFVAARTFDIDKAVDVSGSIYMEAHLKISEGGGDLAPRIYFHDDTAGVTGKVHIGFVGPHYLVPNTKS